MFYRKIKKNIKYVLKNYGMLTSTLRTQQSRYALFIVHSTLCSDKNIHFCFIAQLLDKVTSLNENFRQSS